MKPTNVTGYPFSNGDRLTAVSVNQICNALDAIQDYNDTIKEFEDLVEENTEKLKQQISATTESTAEVVRSMDSVSLASDVQKGKSVIAQAINAKGGSASATDSFNELAQAVEEIPNFDDMAKLAGIIAGGNYNKSELQGHNENVKYGKTEIVDSVGAFEKINVPYCFQYWNLLERVVMPNVIEVKGASIFQYCSSLKTVELPNVRKINSPDMFLGSKIETINFQNLERVEGTAFFPFLTTLRECIFPKLNFIQYWLLRDNTNLVNVVIGTLTNGELFYPGNYAKLRNVTIGEDTNISLQFKYWTATDVIAEGQSSIDELNSNLYNNLLTKLYDHSQDGQTRTLRIGWLAKVTQENIAYANAKGWTLIGEVIYKLLGSSSSDNPANWSTLAENTAQTFTVSLVRGNNYMAISSSDSMDDYISTQGKSFSFSTDDAWNFETKEWGGYYYVWANVKQTGSYTISYDGSTYTLTIDIE